MTRAQEVAKLLASRKLEVEHILGLARTATSADAAALRLLERNLSTAAPGNVPYTKWLDAVCTFLEAGYVGLERLAEEEENIPFVVGVLEELATADALKAMATIAKGPTDTFAQDVAGGINSLASLAKVPILEPETRTELLQFLHSVLQTHGVDDAAYALALYALRGVGDETSLSVLSKIGDATSPYEGAKRAAQMAIKKRLRHR